MKTQLGDYIPKFNIERNEVKITKKKLKKFLGVGLTAVAGYFIYTRFLSVYIEKILFSIPILKDLLQFTLFKVFLLAIVIYYVKDIVD